ALSTRILRVIKRPACHHSHPVAPVVVAPLLPAPASGFAVMVTLVVLPLVAFRRVVVASFGLRGIAAEGIDQRRGRRGVGRQRRVVVGVTDRPEREFLVTVAMTVTM